MIQFQGKIDFLMIIINQKGGSELFNDKRQWVIAIALILVLVINTVILSFSSIATPML